MTPEEFEKVYHELEDKEKSLLIHKREEYANREDALINFKQTANALGITPAEVCSVLLMKHILAVVKQAKDKSTTLNYGDAQREGFAQRISDARNYLMLLAAITREREA